MTQPLITNAQLVGPTVTSVGVSGGVTGLTTSGGPITDSGTITLTGTLSVAHGGTGATDVTTALNSMLPTQTSQAGKVLSTNGTNTSWTTFNLDGLTDVVITTPTTNQTLQYNGTNWVNAATSTSTINLDGLSDVVITTPVTNQILQYNGTNWVNTATAALTAHNGLSSIQGGVTGQYFHITTDQNTTIAAITSASNGLSIKTGLGVFAPRVISGTTNQIATTNGDGIAGNPTISIANDVVLPGTGALTIPVGNTIQRPSGVNGNIRFNSTTGVFEGYQSSWKSIIPTQMDITGSTVPSNGITEGTTVFAYIATTAFMLPISLTSSQFHIINMGGNTGTKTFTIYQTSGSTVTSIGTIVYSTPYTTPIITFASDISFAVGDLLSIVGTTAGEGNFSAIWVFGFKANIL